MRFSMSPKSALAAAAVVVTLGCAAPAAAAAVVYTYTGTIQYGFDQTGLFGANTDLAGLTFTAVFRRDDAKGLTSGYYASNPIQASLTIDGGSAVTFGDSFGEQAQGGTASGSWFRHVAQDERASRISKIMIEVFGPGVGDYLSNGDYHAGTPEYFWNGSMRIQDHLIDPDTGEHVVHHAYATLRPTALTVTTVVPEPAAWALMLTGFFGAGAAIRSRRRAVAWVGQPTR